MEGMYNLNPQLEQEASYDNSKKKSANGTWCNIAKAIQSLPEYDVNHQDLFTMIPASNTSFLFWKDRWCGTLTLQERFPRLYSLEKKKLCTINDRIKTDSFNWCWKVQQMEDYVLSDFISLLLRVIGFHKSLLPDQ